MTKLKAWPIVAGLLVDLIGSAVLGTVYAIVLVAPDVAEGAIQADDPLTAPHLITIEVLGLFMTVAGGYVAARMAKSVYLGHGVGVGVASLLIWLLIEWAEPSTASSEWYDIVLLIAVVPAAAFGGYLAGRAPDTHPTHH